MAGTEFQRWYWLKDELSDFARTCGIRTTGSKDMLTARITAWLDGIPFTESEATPRGSVAQLTGELFASTLIPRGQRCSQIVRAWFIDQVGPSFRFDAQMREFFANSDGTQTMQDALDHYSTTRSQEPKAIEAQFEYNRFTRAWHTANPTGSRQELVHAWQRYRSLPINERGRI